MISSVDFAINIIVIIISLNGITCTAVPLEPGIDIPVENTNELTFPIEINAVIGEDIYFRIMQPLADQSDCFYRRIGEQDVSIRTPNKRK